MMADLQSLACALLESMNDKNVALSHQRKTNKSVQLEISLMVVLRVYKSQVYFKWKDKYFIARRKGLQNDNFLLP